MNRTLQGFLRKEFRQTLRDPRMRLLLFVAPIIQLSIFGVALSTETRNVRLAVAPPGIVERDPLLREIHDKSLASGWFLPAKTPVSDPFEAIRAGRVDAVLVPPPGGLTRAVARGDGQLQLLLDATNVTRAQGVERYLRTIAATVGAAQTLVSGGVALGTPPPLQFDVRILFNPTMRTAVFMVPGVMSMLVCLLTIILTSMSLTKEKETGTFETLISAPVTATEVILGKTIPFVLLGISNIPLILAAGILLFDLPMRGSLALLAFAALVFVICTVGIGIFISTIARNQQQSMMGGFLFLFPATMLSGMMFPIENIPDFLRWLAYLNPLTYFIEILRNILLKGGSPELVLRNIGILALMAFFTIGGSLRRFRTRL
ncbi:MAG: ABC transporter permease [Oligoflexia bacterium]|nr:ABC transporter permease [Oligoflexia bacterium]